MTEAEAFVLSRFSAGWLPPERLDVVEFSERYIPVLRSDVSSTFDRENAPWMIEPMLAITDPHTFFVSLLASTQGGKTTVIINGVTYEVWKRGGDVIYVCQNREEVKTSATSRWIPAWEQCQPVKAMLDRLPKDSINKTQVNFGDFFMEWRGPGANALQGKPFYIVVLDEVWMEAFEVNRTIRQAKGRVTAKQRYKIICLAQGGRKKTAWEAHWLEGTRELWVMPCLECGEKHFPLTEYLVCERTEQTYDFTARAWKYEAVRENTKYKCPDCGHLHDDTESIRKAMTCGGEYQQTNPAGQKRHRSFRWARASVWWEKLCWGNILVEFLQSQDAIEYGDVGPREEFVMKTEAWFWETLGRKEVDSSIIRGGYKLADCFGDAPIDWRENTRRIMAVDVQGDHFWILIREFDRETGASRLVHFERCQMYAWDTVREIQLRWRVPDQLVGVDCRFSSHFVYYGCWLFGWIALEGDRGKEYTHWVLDKKTRRRRAVKRVYGPNESPRVPAGNIPAEYKRRPKNGEAECRKHKWSNKRIKDMVAAARDGDSVVEWQLPDDIDPKYLKMIDAEIPDKSGDWKPRYERIPNHAWDCECMAFTLGIMAGYVKAVVFTDDEEKDSSEAENDA